MKSRRLIIILVVFGCLVMAYVDAILSPQYAIKSSVKLFIFLLIPVGFSFVHKDISLKSLFIFHKKGIGMALLLGISVYVFILIGYFLIKPYFNFSNVTETLQNNIGVNKDNFIYVALYISFINSLLEEFFFRGYAFLCLKRHTSRKLSYLFSASTFAVYHIAIMTSWFSPVLFILLIIGLFFAGILFNWLNEKQANIYTSWMVHMFANFAINTIGFMLFGII